MTLKAGRASGARERAGGPGWQGPLPGPCPLFGCPLVLGEAEVDAAVAGIEPAGGDGLFAGEELEALQAVGLGAAED